MYRKKQDIVFIRTNNGNNLELTNSGVSLGTIPEGFRPATQMDFAGTPVAGTNEVSFRVYPAGAITGYSNPTSKYWNGGFCYPV